MNKKKLEIANEIAVNWKSFEFVSRNSRIFFSVIWIIISNIKFCVTTSALS